MIAIGYRTTTVRAVLAGLAGPAIAILLSAIGISIAALAGNASAPGGLQAVMSAAQNPVATQVHAALQSAAATSTNGVPPVHVAEALMNRALMPQQLRVFGTSANYPVVDPTALRSPGGVSGPWVFDMPTVSRLSALNTPDPDSGDILVAHRLGDYVFCYHGLDWNDSEQSSRWVFFTHPEPSLEGSGPRYGRYCAVHLDGTIESFADEEEFLDALDVENQMRETTGLRSIPDPELIFAEAPWMPRTSPAQPPADVTSDEVPMSPEPQPPSGQVQPPKPEEEPR